MPKNQDNVRLHHMLDSANEALSFAKDKNRSDLNDERKLTLALVKCIEIIGEAATKSRRRRGANARKFHGKKSSLCGTD